MIYIIYIQRFTSVHLKYKFDLIYIKLCNLHLYLLIHLLYVLYSASIRHAGISAIVKQFYYCYYCMYTSCEQNNNFVDFVEVCALTIIITIIVLIIRNICFCAINLASIVTERRITH